MILNPSKPESLSVPAPQVEATKADEFLLKLLELPPACPPQLCFIADSLC